MKSLNLCRSSKYDGYEVSGPVQVKQTMMAMKSLDLCRSNKHDGYEISGTVQVKQT
jgi:hypothetical protein